MVLVFRRRVQLRGDLIEVSIYGFQYQDATAAILTNLDAKLEHDGAAPLIPWLGNRTEIALLFSLTDNERSVYFQSAELLLYSRNYVTIH